MVPYNALTSSTMFSSPQVSAAERPALGDGGRWDAPRIEAPPPASRPDIGHPSSHHGLLCGQECQRLGLPLPISHPRPHEATARLLDCFPPFRPIVSLLFRHLAPNQPLLPHPAGINIDLLSRDSTSLAPVVHIHPRGECGHRLTYVRMKVCAELYVSLFVYRETKLKHTPWTDGTAPHGAGRRAFAWAAALSGRWQGRKPGGPESPVPSSPFPPSAPRRCAGFL